MTHELIVGAIAAVLTASVLVASTDTGDRVRQGPSSCAETLVGELMSQQQTLKTLSGRTRRARDIAEGIIKERAKRGR